SDDERVRAGATRTADALAVILSAGWVLIGVVAVKRRRARGATALALAVAAGLLIVELGPPWWARASWPPLCASTLALTLVLVSIARYRREAPVPPAVAALATVAILVFLVQSAVAQPTVPTTTVLIVTGTDGREEVVAARAALDRIDALAHPQPP